MLKWCLENRKDADFRRAATDYKERVADRQTLFSSYAFDLSPKARLLSRPLFRLGNTLRRAPRKAQEDGRENRVERPRRPASAATNSEAGRSRSLPCFCQILAGEYRRRLQRCQPVF